MNHMKNYDTIHIQNHKSYAEALMIMGNNNDVLIINSQCPINVLGNQNNITITNSKVKLVVTGNENVFNFVECAVQMEIIGNGNVFQSENEVEQLNVTLCLGNGNKYSNMADRIMRRNIFVNQPKSIFGRRQAQQRVNFQSNFENIRNKRNKAKAQRQAQIKLNNQAAETERKRMMQSPAEKQKNSSNYFENYRIAEQQRRRAENQQEQSRIRKQLQKKQQEQAERLLMQRLYPDSPLTKQELNRIPSHPKKGGPEHQCSICLIEIVNNNGQTFLSCFHNFHTVCITQWFKKSSLCPICNENVRKGF